MSDYQADVDTVAEIISTVPDADNDYDTARRILRSSWLAAHDESVRAEERERLARNIEAEAPSPGSAYANAGVAYERGGMLRAARIVREGA